VLEEAKIFEVARFVGISGDAAQRFLGALKACGYDLSDKPQARLRALLNGLGLSETEYLSETEHFLQALGENFKSREERYRDALYRIDTWAEAYPIDVFPEPDLKRAHEVLKAAGLTLDAISAHAMRHVITQAGQIAKEALKRPTKEPA
jgi:hypothetical protein